MDAAVRTKLMKVNNSDFPVPIGFTRAMMEFLTLIFPGPIGYGLMIKDACTVLGISKQAGYQRMMTIKKNFPKINEMYKDLVKLRTKHGNNIRQPKSLGFPKQKTVDGFDGDILTWLENESFGGNPSDAAKGFGLITHIF